MKILQMILLCYAAYCTTLFLLQRKLIYPTYYIPVPEKPAVPSKGVEVILLGTNSGKVESWYLPPRGIPSGQTAPHLIFAHGNAELIDFWVEEFEFLTLLGVGVLLVEFPGYGRSPGNPSQKSITEAFVEGYDTLIRLKKATPSEIIFMGRSIGGGVACSLAAQREPAAMILMSTFTSARSFAKRYLAPPMLLLDPYDNLEQVRSYKKPVLVIHGKNDELIPYGHGEALFKAASLGKLITYDSGHNDCPPDRRAFRKDIADFLHSAGFKIHGPDTAAKAVKQNLADRPDTVVE